MADKEHVVAGDGELSGDSPEERLQQPREDARAARPGHDAAAFLAAIVESSDDAIISKSLQGVITTWNKSAERVFGYRVDEAVGRPITMLIPEDRLDEEPAILARIRAGERVDHFETVRRRKDGSFVDISLTISPIRSVDGVIVGASKIARDISDRKRAAKHQDLLLREMHHRIKNLFAIIGSIITLAARSAQTPAELAAIMKDRLLSLSRAHEMTLPGFSGGEAVSEQSTTLFTLLSSLLSPFKDQKDRRWRLHGEDTPVSADRVTTFALLFHEYATNAAKYGALSVAEGRLDVSLYSRQDSFEIVWQETGASTPVPGQSPETGFGTTLEQMVVRTLNAQVSREWQPHGLLIRLTVPRDAFSYPS